MSELSRGVGMTEQAEGAEVETLTDLLDRWWFAADQPTMHHDGVEYLASIALARTIRASDWLAAREAAAEARGAQAALRDLHDHCLREAGSPVAPGAPAAAERAFWLEAAEVARAAAAAAGGGA